MNKLKYRITLDMLEVTTQKTLKAKRGDTACSIIITLTENGKVYEISEGCYAVFSAKKPDGNYLFNSETCYIKDNTIIYDFTVQTTPCEGTVECEVILYKDNDKLTSPRFNLVVDETVYNGEEIISSSEADALESMLKEIKEIAEGSSSVADETKEIVEQTIGTIKTQNGTIISPNDDYAEVGEWADGNTDDEDRIGYFVSIDDTTAGTTIIKAKSTSDVRGVTVLAPAFSGNCSADKFNEDKTLKQKYEYVATMGIVSVIDNGTCTINERCMPDDNGCAIPSSNNMGYQVIDRIDDTHILIALEPNGDMVQKIKKDVSQLQEAVSKKLDKENYEYIDTIIIADDSRLYLNFDDTYKKILLFSAGKFAVVSGSKYFFINNDYSSTSAPIANAPSSFNNSSELYLEIITDGTFMRSESSYSTNMYLAGTYTKNVRPYTQNINSIKSSCTWLSGTELKIYGVKS